jgi:hypothetical protein
VKKIIIGSIITAVIPIALKAVFGGVTQLTIYQWYIIFYMLWIATLLTIIFVNIHRSIHSEIESGNNQIRLDLQNDLNQFDNNSIKDILKSVRPFFKESISYSFYSIFEKEQMEHDRFISKILSLNGRFLRLYEMINNQYPIDPVYTELINIIKDLEVVIPPFSEVVKQKGWISEEVKSLYYELYCRYNPTVLLRIEEFLNKNIKGDTARPNDVYFRPLPDLSNIEVRSVVLRII